jgi:hypothetical protein
MALSQKGANYEGRDAIANPPEDLKLLAHHVMRALDDIASQNQATRTQGNFGQSGPPAAPHPITAIAVSASAGFATLTLTHASAPPGCQYRIQYSTTPNFQNPITVDNGDSLTFHKYLKGLNLYFRAAPKFPASEPAEWIYFGGQAKPTPVAF